MLIDNFKVEAPHVSYSDEYITSTYEYGNTKLVQGEGGQWVVKPWKESFEFRTKRAVPKLGVMLVGWGGNNGTTLTAGVLANKL